MHKQSLVLASAVAIVLLAKTSNAVEIVSGNEMTNVILTGSDFTWNGSGTTAKVGVDNLYNYWDANPGSSVSVIGGTTVTDINLGVNGGRDLRLESMSSFRLYGNITGSTVSGEGGSLNVGANFFDGSGLAAVFLGSGSQLGSFQELDSIYVNAQAFKIESRSSVTLGEGDTLKLARSWYDLNTGVSVADLPDSTAFVNNGRVEQLGANSLVDIRGFFMNNGQYVLQGGALKIKKDAYISTGAGVFDQYAGSTNTVKGNLIIENPATYNMYGGQLNAVSISSGSSYSPSYVSDGVDVNGNQRWILTGVDIGAADGRFNYVDGGVRTSRNDMYIRAGGMLGQNIVMDTGESFGAKNMYIGTLDDGLTNFAGQGVGALASGSIVMNGGSNRVVEDMVIGTQATMTQNNGLNDVGGNLYIDGGSYTQNSGSNTIAGSLWLGDGGQYTMNGGQLNVGTIERIGDSTGYCQQVALNSGFTAGNNCDQLGTPQMTVTTSVNYINGGVRLTNGDLSVSQNGALGNSLLIDEANETFGAVNMTVGTSVATNGGSINQSTGQNLIRNTLRIEANGSYDLSGGQLEFGRFAGSGKINFTGGGIYSGSDITIGTSGAVGSSLMLNTGMTLSAQKNWQNPRNNVVIDAGAELVLDGGELIAADIVKNGAFNYVSGSLDLNNLTIGSNGLFSSLSLTSSQNLYVRNSITIEAGATFEIGSALGGRGSFNGNAIITNSGSLVLNNGTLNASQINNVGAGSFAFNSGSLALASLNIGSTGLLGQTVSLDASRKVNAGNLNIEAGARLEITGGRSTAANLTNQGVVVIGASGQLNGSTYVQDLAAAVTTVDGVLNTNVVITDGQLNGSGTITGSLSNDGNFNPGNSPGLLTVNGDFTQLANGALTIELGGLLSGIEFDVVDVGGTANLAGTLNVDLFDLGGGLFAPSLGDTFDFLTAESIVGDFDLLTLAALGNGLGWELNYLYDAVGTLDIARLSVVEVSAVPVPAAVWLFGSGLLGLIAVARKKKL